MHRVIVFISPKVSKPMPSGWSAFLLITRMTGFFGLAAGMAGVDSAASV